MKAARSRVHVILKLPNTASEVEELLAQAVVEAPLMMGSMDFIHMTTGHEKDVIVLDFT